MSSTVPPPPKSPKSPESSGFLNSFSNSQGPLLIQPFAVPKPWGGRYLNDWQHQESLENRKMRESKGTQNPQKPKEPIGELVLVSGLEVFPTYVFPTTAKSTNKPDDSRHEGRQTFLDYWRDEGGRIAVECGSRFGPDYFPLLLKILSTNEPLSLQVHPSTRDLREKFDIEAVGKLESWVVLEADRDAQIFFGFKDEYSEDEWMQIGQRDDPLDLLYLFKPKQGDTFKLEPGLVHGTKGGLLFLKYSNLQTIHSGFMILAEGANSI